MPDESDDWHVEPMSTTHPFVEASSQVRLPLSPKGSLRNFRSDLGTAVRQLVASEGQILSAIYCSSSTEQCDTENVLLFNVCDPSVPGTSCFAASTRNGLQFERIFAKPVDAATRMPTATHYHRYEIVSDRQPFFHWEMGRRLADFRTSLRGVSLEKPVPIWYALKRGFLETDSTALPTEETFMLRLTLHGVVSVPKHAALAIKALIDGVVLALQSHEDASTLGEVAGRIAASIGADVAEIIRLLTDSKTAVLGKTTRLFHIGKRDLQSNPCDDRCVAAALLIHRETNISEGRFLTGSAFEAIARAPSEMN